VDSSNLAETLWRASNVWVEYRNAAIPQSILGQKFYKFGKTLVSKTHGRGGADNYAFMREPLPGDPVIHVLKEKSHDWEIIGVSTIARRCIKRSDKEVGEYYLIQLTSFVYIDECQKKAFLYKN
jgi:hypothetical protein